VSIEKITVEKTTFEARHSLHWQYSTLNIFRDARCSLYDFQREHTWHQKVDRTSI